jgi:hypothetical protein
VLDDLENGILRGNAPGASSLGMLLKLPWLSKGPFKAGDPRAQHVRAGQGRLCQQHAAHCIVPVHCHAVGSGSLHMGRM